MWQIQPAATNPVLVGEHTVCHDDVCCGSARRLELHLAAQSLNQLPELGDLLLRIPA
jgi:hypothetical protein